MWEDDLIQRGSRRILERTRAVPGYLSMLGFLCLMAFQSPVGADWATFGRFDAIAEIRLVGRQAHVDLRFRDDTARERLGLMTDSTLPARLDEVIGIEGSTIEPDSVQAETIRPDGRSSGQAAISWRLKVPEGRQSLKIQTRLKEGSGTLGVIVLDRGIPVADLGPLVPSMRIQINDENPWDSRFLEVSRVRMHSTPRSYLYLDADFIRHELLIPLRSLEASPEAVNSFGNDPEAIKAKLSSGMTELARLKVNGRLLEPQVEQISLLSYDRTGMLPVALGAEESGNEKLVGAVLLYPLGQPIETLELEWRLFPKRMESERPISIVVGRETFEGSVSAQSPVFSFQRDDLLDGSVLNGAKNLPEATRHPHPDSGQIAEILEILLLNAYRAFAIRDEESALDRLALSLSGNLLETIYLQQRKSFLKRDLGLAGEGRVNRIVMTRVSIFPKDAGWRGFSLAAIHARGPAEISLEASWRAIGEVSHWGHSHPRDNGYQAQIRLQKSEDGGWRLTGMNFIDGHGLAEAVRP